MKKKNKNKIKVFLLIIIGVFALTIATGDVSAEPYKNLELIPGQERTSDFLEYLNGIYKFGIAIAAILAIFMISFGAFSYMVTSAGNASKMIDAKGTIYSAIFGLILAMTAFLLLYLINPDLVGGKVKQAAETGVSQKTLDSGQVVISSTKYAGYNSACPEEKQSNEARDTDPIDYTKSPPQALASACDQYNNIFEEYGSSLDSSGYKGACILKTIAHLETRCVLDKKSPAGACGMMQLLPSTAGTTCEQLKQDARFSVEKAAKYIRDNLNNTNRANDRLSAILAGYNSGYGSTTPTGKKPSLADSNDCVGNLAFECCINPGGLAESIAYAWNGWGLYNYCMGQRGN